MKLHICTQACKDKCFCGHVLREHRLNPLTGEIECQICFDCEKYSKVSEDGKHTQEWLDEC